jgi:ABC-type nitrate/sulfonate/bicarbonate transport system substrate-binding protein
MVTSPLGGLSRRQFIRRGVGTGVAVTGAGWLAACGGDEEEAGKGGSDPSLGIVSFPGPSISSHSKALIIGAGLATKNGWKLDWPIRSTAEAYYNDFVRGVYDGVDFAGANSFAGLYEKGAPIKIVAASVQYPYPFCARSETGIKTLADLRGKRVGLPTASYVSGYIKAIAESEGIDLDEEAEVANIDIIQAANLLRRGDYDAAPILFEDVIRVERDSPGAFTVIFDTAKEFGRLVGLPSAYQYLAIRDNWLEKDGDVVPSVLATYTALGEFIADNPRKAVDILAKPDSEKGAALEPEVGQAEYVNGFDGMKTVWLSRPVSELKESLKKEFEIYERFGLIESIPDDGIFYES